MTAQQILDAYNAVANGGVFVSPRLVRATVTPSGGVAAAKPSPSHRVIDPATNAQLVQMLEGVVSSGTGTSAAIDGYTVAGKTGTAQIPDPNHLGYIPGAYVGSFAGFAPAEDPVLSAVVVLDHPTPIYGGAVAAPVFSTIMAYALHHYGIPTTAAATTSASNSAVGGTGTHLGADRSDHGRALGGPPLVTPASSTPTEPLDHASVQMTTLIHAIDAARGARRPGVDRHPLGRVRQPSGGGGFPVLLRARRPHRRTPPRRRGGGPRGHRPCCASGSSTST